MNIIQKEFTFNVEKDLDLIASGKLNCSVIILAKLIKSVVWLTVFIRLFEAWLIKT